MGAGVPGDGGWGGVWWSGVGGHRPNGRFSKLWRTVEDLKAKWNLKDVTSHLSIEKLPRKSMPSLLPV